MNENQKNQNNELKDTVELRVTVNSDDNLEKKKELHELSCSVLDPLFYSVKGLKGIYYYRMNSQTSLKVLNGSSAVTV